MLFIHCVLQRGVWFIEVEAIGFITLFKVPSLIPVSSIPDLLLCTMNHWNPVVAKCSAKEETELGPYPVPGPELDLMLEK